MEDQVVNKADVELYKMLLEPIVPSIQESVFVKHFLPLLAGQLKDAPVSEWLHVAGNAHNPVNVYRGNEFLYQVPALLGDVAFISVMGSREHAISEIVATAQRLSAIAPRYGEEHLREALVGRVVDGEPNIESIKQWNNIFERYGIDKIPLASAGATAEGSENGDAGNPTISGIEDF